MPPFGFCWFIVSDSRFWQDGCVKWAFLVVFGAYLEFHKHCCSVLEAGLTSCDKNNITCFSPELWTAFVKTWQHGWMTHFWWRVFILMYWGLIMSSMGIFFLHLCLVFVPHMQMVFLFSRSFYVCLCIGWGSYLQVSDGPYCGVIVYVCCFLSLF